MDEPPQKRQRTEFAYHSNHSTSRSSWSHANGQNSYTASNSYANSYSNSYSNSYPKSSIVRADQNLPIFKIKDKVIDALKQHKTVIFIGETASGKTTQIPQFIYETRLNGNKAIAVTQPRRVAAMSIAKRVAEEVGTELGNLVGYSVRFDTKAGYKTVIKYVTDGMLLREAITDPKLSAYSVVVLDEAHERSISTDLLFGVVKRAQKLRQAAAVGGDQSPLKVVVMSATMDVDHFAAYFDAPVFYLVGRQHEIKYKYVDTESEDYVEDALVTVFQIHQHEDEGCVR